METQNRPKTLLSEIAAPIALTHRCENSLVNFQNSCKTTIEHFSYFCCCPLMPDDGTTKVMWEWVLSRPVAIRSMKVPTGPAIYWLVK